MTFSEKQQLRDIMKEKRQILFQQHPEASKKIITLFLDFMDTPSPQKVGGYWPIGSELDIRPLLHKLIEKGFMCALPCVTLTGLLFRAWEPPLSLVKGKFQIWEPPLTSSPITPDILLVPLLAFDKRGHRLGYGQGHYDRYLQHHQVITIGVGFKDQEVDHLPSQPHDFPLNFILTETEIIKGI